MISDFVQGDNITGFFALVTAQVIPYDRGERLRLEFSDASGKIEGILWEDASAVFNEIRDADVVKVRGLVSSYRDKPQLKVEKIRPARDGEYDIADLLKVVEGGIEKQIELFDKIIATIEDEFLAALLRLVRNDSEVFENYMAAPAGKRFHHDYIGGLAQHSLSIAYLADGVCAHYPKLNRDLLICGAIFHDIGKTYELTSGVKLDYTDEGRLVGHIALGDQIVVEYISQIPDFPEKLEFKLRHMIASHHGEKQYGAPVVPQTREAYVLHLLDRIDSGLNVFEDYDEKRDGDWGGYVNLWERYLYFG
jgi:3'-5' exoribonuclease